jgi:hypothetical protein
MNHPPTAVGGIFEKTHTTSTLNANRLTSVTINSMMKPVKLERGRVEASES